MLKSANPEIEAAWEVFTKKWDAIVFPGVQIPPGLYLIDTVRGLSSAGNRAEFQYYTSSASAAVEIHQDIELGVTTIVEVLDRTVKLYVRGMRQDRNKPRGYIFNELLEDIDGGDSVMSNQDIFERIYGVASVRPEAGAHAAGLEAVGVARLAGLVGFKADGEKQTIKNQRGARRSNAARLGMGRLGAVLGQRRRPTARAKAGNPYTGRNATAAEQSKTATVLKEIGGAGILAVTTDTAPVDTSEDETLAQHQARRKKLRKSTTPKPKRQKLRKTTSSAGSKSTRRSKRKRPRTGAGAGSSAAGVVTDPGSDMVEEATATSSFESALTDSDTGITTRVTRATVAKRFLRRMVPGELVCVRPGQPQRLRISGDSDLRPMVCFVANGSARGKWETQQALESRYGAGRVTLMRNALERRRSPFSKRTHNLLAPSWLPCAVCGQQREDGDVGGPAAKMLLAGRR